MSKFLVNLCLLLSCCTFAMSQVTTSAISGLVLDENEEPLSGATITAIHETSGTHYGTITNTHGNYYLQGLRTGGPYRIEISYVGYGSAAIADVYLQLAETYSCNVTLQPSVELDEVVIVAVRTRYASEKTGASTHITSDDMLTLPNINRSFSDITKLSPYANGNGFGGRDQRMNNYSIDGANFNYSMGLDGAVLPGGGNPVSLDALEEVQVSIAPYDVRQTNFIGASVNAVTKSGTNQLRGSAYIYVKNKHLRGNRVNGEDLGERAEEKRNIYGFTLGGPILKNKLFFFVNGEYENQPAPIHKWKLSTDGNEDVENRVSRVTDADMRCFSQDLKSMYGYDTGSWTDFSGGMNTYRAMARVDWNISDRNRLMFRYNYTSQQKDNNVVGAALDVNGSPVGRYSMAFRNSTWKQSNNVSSLTMELNSHLGHSMNNKLLVSYTFNDGNKRECKGDFPTVDIMKPDEQGIDRPFMNAGYDQHAWRNGIKERVWSVSDHFSAQAGNHQLTGGISFESQYVSNCYMRYGAGYYRYASYDDFVNRAAPTAFALTYSLTGEDRALSEVHYEQFSLYVQDDYNVNSRLKLVYGVRMDIPFYVNKRYENPSITGYNFNGVQLSTAYWPKATPLISPRIGINYDLLGNNRLKLRGGTGIFTGRFPLIFLSKMQEGSGMLQTTVSTTKLGDPLLAALAGGIRTPQQILQEIAPRFPDRFLTEPGAINSIITIDRKFKMPQVWKTSLALDWQLPLPFKADMIFEGIYIKDINAILQKNMNVIGRDDPKMSVFSGNDNRALYPGKTEKYIYQEITDAMLMTNTGKGYSYTLNAVLNMMPVKDLNLMASYTYTRSRSLSNNSSNQIDGVWRQEPSVQGANYLTLHNSKYVQSPHRMIAEVSYAVRYARNYATMISLFYSGQRYDSYSYLYGNDMNRDGYVYDLLYIPADRTELNFQDLKVGDRTFTASEQQDAFWAFIDQDTYLKEHKGEYAETNGAFLPWVNRFDLRLAQDFRVKVGKTMNTLQFTVDMMNIGNLLNSSWGVTKSVRTNKLLNFRGMNDANEPVYTMVTQMDNGVPTLPAETFIPNRISDNCWQIQFGLRYIFN